MLPEDDNVKLTCWRNRLAITLSNWILRYIATRGYRNRLDLFIRAGMEDVYGHSHVVHDIIRNAWETELDEENP